MNNVVTTLFVDAGQLNVVQTCMLTGYALLRVRTGASEIMREYIYWKRERMNHPLHHI